MLSAKLAKALGKEGFELEYPDYSSNEEIILEILKEGDARITKSLPLFLKYGFDYRGIVRKLDVFEKKEFDKAIIISAKIFAKERVENEVVHTINENKIKSQYSNDEFSEYYDSYKESKINTSKEEQKIIEKQSKLRINLDLNRSLEILFSPAKIRILKKIFDHEKLTNTELKYYYKSISNINKSVLNRAVQDYLRVIEISKKLKE